MTKTDISALDSSGLEGSYGLGTIRFKVVREGSTLHLHTRFDGGGKVEEDDAVMVPLGERRFAPISLRADAVRLVLEFVADGSAGPEPTHIFYGGRLHAREGAAA